MYPSWIVGDSIEALMKKTEIENDSGGIGTLESDTFLRSLHHVAVRLKCDLKKTPGLAGYNLNQEDAA